MKKTDSLIRVIVLFTMLISLFAGPGYNAGFTVFAQPVGQEEVPTATLEVPPAEPPSEPVLDVPTDVPTEEPQVEPTVAPTDEPIEIPTDIPVDVPTDIPTETPTLEPTLEISETPTVTPTETETPTPTPTLLETPIEVPEFKWNFEINLNPDQAASLGDDLAMAQENSGRGVSTSISGDRLALTGNQDINQVRSAIFDGLNSQIDFLGGPAEIDIYVPAETNQEISIALESRPSTGYRWEVVPGTDISFIRKDAPGFTSRTQGYGANEYETFVVKSNGTGDGNLRLVYARPFEPIANINSRLNIWLPMMQSSIDLSDPTPSSVPAAPENEIAAAQSNPIEEIPLRGLPAAWDWRDQGVVPAVRDQGSCGSCWAFGTVGIMESALKIADGTTADISEQFLVSCNNHGWSCNGGLTAHMYHQYTIGKSQTIPGAVLESAKPYTATNGTCSLIAAHPYTLRDWSFVGASESTIPTVDQIKNAIYTYGPVTAGICAGNNFNNYTGGVMSTSDVCTYGTNHQIILVGWNNAEQSWILRNSWGPFWGESGYMRIKWNTSRVGEGTSWVTYGAADPVPAVPVLVSPAINGLVSDTTPELSWSQVAYGNTYQVQISQYSNFSVLTENSVTLPDVLSFSPASPLSGDGPWYWRVKAINANGREGDWSAARAFILDTAGPAAPVLAFPDNGSSPVGTPTFRWLAALTANAYQFEYGTSADSGSTITPVYATPDGTTPGQPALTTLTYKPPAMTSGILYYWHVRARDAAGNWGDWSSARSVNVQDSIPLAPALLSPLTGSVTNIQPTLTWNAVTGGADYQIQIANNATFSGTLFEEAMMGGVVLTYDVTNPLTDGTWYWRVRAWNATGGAGPWSLSRTFVFDITPPPAPALSLPAADVIVRTTPAFSWGASLTGAAYQFEYGTSTNGLIGTFIPVYTASPSALRTHTPPAMTYGGYYWHVKARDAVGNWGDWGELRKINVNPPILAAPVLQLPVLNAMVNTLSPTFSWNTVTGAKNYTIQVAKLATFSSADVDTKTYTLPDGDTTYDASSDPLPHDGIWYWRVATTNSMDEMGLWSSARKFTIDVTAPAAPNLLLPADNSSTLTAIPLFTWSAVLGANAYQFQFDDDSGFADPIQYSTPGEGVPGTPITVASHKPAMMNVMTPYYWRVKARDAAGNWGDWSVTRTITLVPPKPAAPVPTALAAGTITNNATPTFSWSQVFAGDTYEIQIDNAATFTLPIEQTTDGLGLNYTASALGDGVWYWRVRAINAALEAGPWSAARNFNIDTTAPAAPALNLPADNPAGIRAIPIFSWKASVGANAYQFQYDDDSGFADPILYSTPGEGVSGTPLAVLSHKPTGMAVMTPYYWRVQARDAAGNWSGWSEVRTITILPAVPTAPLASSPAAGFLTSDTTPSFTWNAVPTGDTYEIQIDNAATFTLPIEQTANGLGLNYTASALGDGLWYWRVRAINAALEVGPWSAARNFTIDTTAPAAPALNLPVDNPAGIRATPIFSWKASVGANAYQFQYDDDSGFTNPILYSTPGEGVSGTPLAVLSHKPTGMTVMTSYYWRVQARDAAGNWSGWSEVRTITILPAVPTAPMLTYPASAFLTSDTTPSFTWNAVPTGDTYEIQIDNAATFTLPIEQTTDGLGLNYTASALGDGLWYWRVRAINAASEAGPWSAARNFTIDTTAPAAPVLSLPVEGTTLPAGVPTFSWFASVGANAYQFQYDDDSGFSNPIVYSTPGEGVSGTPLAGLSHKPATMAPAITYYWRVKARDAAGNWGVWSSSRAVVVQAAIPAAPILVSPTVGQVLSSEPDHRPVFRWNPALNGNTYQIQVSNSTTFASLLMDATTTTPGETTYTTPSPGFLGGILNWRVRAINANGKAGLWSASRTFSILHMDSSFDSNSTGWSYNPGGTWSLSGGSLTTTGSSSNYYTSSANFNANYANFTYEARMKMGFDYTVTPGYLVNAHGIVVKANPVFNSWNDFRDAYYFQIGQYYSSSAGRGYGCFTLDKYTNGVYQSLTGGYWWCDRSINFENWNVLKAVSNGTSLSFYVNNVKMVTTTTTAASGGVVGVVAYKFTGVSKPVSVDWARLTAPQLLSAITPSREASDGFYFLPPAGSVIKK